MSIRPAMTETRRRRDETEKSSNVKILKKKLFNLLLTLYGGFLFPWKRFFYFQIGHFRVPKISHLAWCKAFLGKMRFICMRISNHFRTNSLALSLALKPRLAISKCQPWLFAPPSQHPSRGDKARETLLPGRQLVRGWGGGERRDGWYFLHSKDITLS